MKPNALALLTVSFFLVTSALWGQKAKTASVGNYPFWSNQKGGYSGQYIPGLNAVLLLTSAQIEQIGAARQSTVDSDSVREAARLGKDLNASEADRQAARVVWEKAQQDLRLQVESILTADQKALIKRIDALYADSRGKVAKDFESRLISAKTNGDDITALRKEMQDRASHEFSQALDTILSAEQKAAMTRAAESEKQAAAIKKPDK